MLDVLCRDIKIMKLYNKYFISGTILIILGIFFPRDWYDSLPKLSGMSQPPIKGVTLLQMCTIIEGLVFIWLYLKRWNFISLKESEKISVIKEIDEDKLISKQQVILMLGLITLLAFILRIVKINSDLWLDEIVSIVNYRDFTTLQIVGSYLKSNNHLLNTLLIKLSIGVFGEKEWSARLPAVIFGTATIPALYWVSRMMLPRIASLGVALLLTVSYHHIFFSQNARGYTAYLFFSILSSGLLIKALKDDSADAWIFYITTMFFNFASLLISIFVFTSHILIGAIVIIKIKKKGLSPIPMARRLFGVFTITALVSFQLYATVIPQAYLVMKSVYTDSAAGYSLFSAEFIKEIIRGMSAGFGPLAMIGAFLFLIIAITGFVALLRKNWILVSAFVMPVILTAVCLSVRGLAISPRLFLLSLPFTMLVAVEGIFNIAKFIASMAGSHDNAIYRKSAIIMILIGCVVSLASLKNYYSVHKQPYRPSIQYLESIKQPEDIVLVIHLAEVGYRYYCNRLGIDIGESGDYFFVRSMDKLNKALSSREGKNSYLVTTFPRALHILYPELEKRITNDWIVAKSFPATIGGGGITIWVGKKT